MSNKEKQAPWVKWYPIDFLNGVLFKLHIEAIGVYSVLLNLIYENGGPIADDISVLSRRMSMRPSSLEKRLAELVAAKKIMRVDGVISNNRAEIEIEARVKKLEESRGKVGENSTKSREKVTEKINGFNGHTPPDSESDIRRRVRAPSERSARGPTKAPKSVRIDPHRKATDQNFIFARSRGLTKREIEFEWMRFVRYYAGRNDSAPNAKSPDWDAVWESWVLKRAAELDREPLVDGEQQAGKLDPAHLPRDVWERSVELWRKGVQWPEDLGPEPGQPGCKAPIDLVRLS